MISSLNTLPKRRTRESLNLGFPFSKLCKNRHSLFFPWGLHLLSEQSHIFESAQVRVGGILICVS